MAANDLLITAIILKYLRGNTLSQIYEHKAKAGNVANGTPTLEDIFEFNKIVRQGDGELAQGNMPTNEQQQQQQIQNNTRQQSIRRQYIHQRLQQSLNHESGVGEIEGNKVEAQQCASNQQHETSQKIANPEKEKKIRNVAKKLSDIKKLKARQEQGEVLELNQLNKIAIESKFLKELRELKLSS